jgi:hypothetical protein
MKLGTSHYAYLRSRSVGLSTTAWCETLLERQSFWALDPAVNSAR